MSIVNFVKEDTTTGGNWYFLRYTGTYQTVYGGDGYAVLGQKFAQGASSAGYTPGPTTDYYNYPAYATVTPSGESGYVWADNATPGLEYAPPGTSNGTDSNRVQGAWYAASSFTVEINDGSAHQIALYFADYGETNLAEMTVTVKDHATQTTLDGPRTLSNFSSGIWLVWTVSGNVDFVLAEVSVHAVVSGIFFDTPFPPFQPLVSRPRFEPAHFE